MVIYLLFYVSYVLYVPYALSYVFVFNIIPQQNAADKMCVIDSYENLLLNKT